MLDLVVLLPDLPSRLALMKSSDVSRQALILSQVLLSGSVCEALNNFIQPYPHDTVQPW